MRVTVLGLSERAAADQRKCCATGLRRGQEHTVNTGKNTACVNVYGCFGMGLPQNWGSGGDSRLRVTVVGSREALPEAAAECAAVDGAANLEQPVSAAA